MRTLVAGLGNPIVGDDAAGWKVAQQLQQAEAIPPEVSIECLSLGGISLMEALIGYERAILVDAVVTGKFPVGTVKKYELEELPDPGAGHTSSPHDTSLKNALEVGLSLGAELPKDISIVTIEAQQVYEFSEELTPAVARAIPEAVRIILNLLIESRTDTAPTQNISRDEEGNR